MEISDRKQQLQDRYRDSLPVKAEHLRRCYDNAADFKEVYEALHKLAGSAGMYGFDRISELASELLVMLDRLGNDYLGKDGDFEKKFAQLQRLLKNSG